MIDLKVGTLLRWHGITTDDDDVGIVVKIFSGSGYVEVNWCGESLVSHTPDQVEEALFSGTLEVVG